MVRKNISDFWNGSQKICSKFKKVFFLSNALDPSTAISIWCRKNESARGKVIKKLSAKTAWNHNWNSIWLMILSTSKDNASTVTRRRQQKGVKRGWNSGLIQPLKLAANGTLSKWKRLSGESNTLDSFASPLQRTAYFEPKGDLREGEKHRFHCPRMETVHFILELLCGAKFKEEKS